MMKARQMRFGKPAERKTGSFHFEIIYIPVIRKDGLYLDGKLPSSEEKQLFVSYKLIFVGN